MDGAANKRKTISSILDESLDLVNKDEEDFLLASENHKSGDAKPYVSAASRLLHEKRIKAEQAKANELLVANNLMETRNISTKGSELSGNIYLDQISSTTVDTPKYWAGNSQAAKAKSLHKNKDRRAFKAAHKKKITKGQNYNDKRAEKMLKQVSRKKKV